MFLNQLTKKYLDIVKPKSVLFLGIAGGNGLEHVDNNITYSVIGIDINQQYLEHTRTRYCRGIRNLKLINLDISESSDSICKSELIWAALILEYTGVEKALEFSRNNITYGGSLIVTIQSNNGVQSISLTGVESVNIISSVFQLVNPDSFLVNAKELGFVLIDCEENFLPNGKSMKTFHFIWKD